MSFTSAGWTHYDLKGNEVARNPGKAGDVPHFTNFIDCIFTGDRPNSDIAEGQTSTRWCHLANIAWRTGQTLDVNPETGKIVDNAEAEALWGRDYRPGWEPKV